MIETNMMIQRSNLTVCIGQQHSEADYRHDDAPTLIGIPNSILRAMAPPSTSASEVETLASMAEIRMGRLSIRGIYLLVASERQSPVTIPKWATLCWMMISMMEEKVTTQSRA